MKPSADDVYTWRDWSIRYRTDNRSQRPWTLEHSGRRIATFITLDTAKRQALTFIQEDHGPEIKVTWLCTRPDNTQPTAASQLQIEHRCPRISEARQRLLDALDAYVAERIGGEP